MNLIDIDELKVELERGVYHQNIVNGEKVFRISDIVLAGKRCKNQIVLYSGLEPRRAQDETD